MAYRKDRIVAVDSEGQTATAGEMRKMLLDSVARGLGAKNWTALGRRIKPRPKAHASSQTEHFNLLLEDHRTSGRLAYFAITGDAAAPRRPSWGNVEKRYGPEVVARLREAHQRWVEAKAAGELGEKRR